jgi:hypothetical protein
MSTALVHHHHRSQMIAAGAAVLGVAAVGVVLGINHDSSPAPNTPSVTTSVPHFRLTGGTNEQGNWNHAGTISGGQTQTGP